MYKEKEVMECLWFMKLYKDNEIPSLSEVSEWKNKHYYDSFENAIFKMSDGNPGALTFMMQLIQNTDTEKGLLTLLRFDNMELYGSRLYQLWNDCCDRDIDKVMKVLEQFSGSEILAHIDNGRGYGDKFTF